MRKKYDNVYLKIAYQLHVQGAREAIKIKSSSSFPRLVDRSPLSDFAYEIVRDINIKTKKDVLKIIEKCFPSGSPATLWLASLPIIIITPTDIEKTLDLMKGRNNGIDILTKKYVLKQNLVFSALAEFFKYKHINIAHARTNELKFNISFHINLLVETRTAKAFNRAYAGKAKLIQGLVHRGYANDAGWDLYNYKVEEIAPSIWKVHTACRVKISPGYFGLIKERSSALLSNGQYYPTIIQGGVIDAGFEGEISIILYSLRTYCDLQLVYCGRYTHQLIILPCSCSNVVGFKDRPENAGFGSSTGSYNF